MADGILEHRVSRVETDVLDMKDALKSIAESLHTLARLQAHYAETRDGLQRAFAEIEKNREISEEKVEKLGDRVREVEINLPTLKLTSGWVISGIIFAAVAVGAALVQLIFK